MGKLAGGETDMFLKTWKRNKIIKKLRTTRVYKCKLLYK